MVIEERRRERKHAQVTLKLDVYHKFIQGAEDANINISRRVASRYLHVNSLHKVGGHSDRHGIFIYLTVK